MKTIIPAGYRLTVTTWENDADNYNTEILEGLSESDVRMYVVLCEKMSRSDDYENRICNLYEPGSEDFGRVREFSKVLFAQFPEYLREHFELSFDEFTDDKSAVLDCFFEVASMVGATGGEFFTRVVSEWKIEHISAPIELEDVTAKFMS